MAIRHDYVCILYTEDPQWWPCGDRNCFWRHISGGGWPALDKAWYWFNMSSDFCQGFSAKWLSTQCVLWLTPGLTNNCRPYISHTIGVDANVTNNLFYITGPYSICPYLMGCIGSWWCLSIYLCFSAFSLYCFRRICCVTSQMGTTDFSVPSGQQNWVTMTYLWLKIDHWLEPSDLAQDELSVGTRPDWFCEWPNTKMTQTWVLGSDHWNTGFGLVGNNDIDPVPSGQTMYHIEPWWFNVRPTFFKPSLNYLWYNCHNYICIFLCNF